MKRVLIGCAVMALAGVTTGEARRMQEPVDADMNAKIREEGLQRSQVEKPFDMFVNVIGPRLTGSPAHKRAAEWARDTLTAWGLSSVHLEPWEFGRGWELDKLTIEMVEPRYFPLTGYAEAWTPSTPGEITAAAVSLAGKSPQEIVDLAASIKGAALLQQPVVTNFIAADRLQPTEHPDAPTGAPRTGAPGGRRGGAGRGGSRGRGAADPEAQALAQRANDAIQAAGVMLVPSRGQEGTVFVQAGRDNPANRVPRIVLEGEHYNMIARLLEHGIPVKLRVNVQTRFLDADRNSYNVIAEIPGVDPALKDEVVMLGGHLDSWHAGTGATDNADGAAVVMEAFRILKAIGVRPKRTLRLALWSGEEEGLYGSQHYAADHLEGDAHAAARQKMDVYFNIDPGKGPIYGWYLEDNEAVKPIFDAWLAPFRDLGAVRNVMPGIGSTDHLSFIRAGVPGFNPVQDYVDYDVRLHHTNADTFERIDLKDLQQNAIVLASFVYHAAQRPEMLPSTVRK